MDKQFSEEEARETLRLANIIYFRSGVFDQTKWMGIPTAKCPMDMWVYQELMHELKTDLLIETGTLFGGSALFFAQIFDMMGNGKVLTIDIEERKNLPSHPRIEYIVGSSIDPTVIDEVDNVAEGAESVMVILDSDHKAPFKLKELELYSKFVSRGSYIVAEDSVFDFYPAWPEYGPGPAAAIKVFMKNNDQFEVDRSQEKHMITFAPIAFLRKKT